MTPTNKRTKAKDTKGREIPNLFIDIKTGTYYWREYINGKEYERSTRCNTIGAAITKVKQFRQEAQGIVEKRRKSFNEVFDLVLKLQSQKSSKTYEMARTQIDVHLRPWFDRFCPWLDRFNEGYWVDYVKFQKGENPKRKLEHDRRHLLMSLRRAHREGWIKRSWSKSDLYLDEHSDPIGKFLEDDEVNSLLFHAKALGRAEKRYSGLYLQILIAVTMGMRKSEILKLSWREVDFKSQSITFILDSERGIKTRKGRTVPINDVVMPFLEERRRNGEGDFVFPGKIEGKPQGSNKKSWETCKNLAGVNCRFHDLRHTFYTNALMEGMIPEEVSKIGGADIKVIREIYFQLNKDSMQRSRKLFRGKFGDK